MRIAISRCPSIKSRLSSTDTIRDSSAILQAERLGSLIIPPPSLPYLPSFSIFSSSSSFSLGYGTAIVHSSPSYASTFTLRSNKIGRIVRGQTYKLDDVEDMMEERSDGRLGGGGGGGEDDNLLPPSGKKFTSRKKLSSRKAPYARMPDAEVFLLPFLRIQFRLPFLPTYFSFSSSLSYDGSPTPWKNSRTSSRGT